MTESGICHVTYFPFCSHVGVHCQQNWRIICQYDRVPHERLLKKLDDYGIGDSTQGWIKAFLSNRTQQVIVEGATSDTVPVISGVPQGTVLGDPCCF